MKMLFLNGNKSLRNDSCIACNYLNQYSSCTVDRPENKFSCMQHYSCTWIADYGQHYKIEPYGSVIGSHKSFPRWCSHSLLLVGRCLLLRTDHVYDRNSCRSVASCEAQSLCSPPRFGRIVPPSSPQFEEFPILLKRTFACKVKTNIYESPEDKCIAIFEPQKYLLRLGYGTVYYMLAYKRCCIISKLWWQLVWSLERSVPLDNVFSQHGR